MRTPFTLLAGAAALALAAGVAHAQAKYSWGDSTTTYFYSPSTTDSYSPSGPPPADARPPDVESLPVPAQPDPSFYQAPDSYGIYRRTPAYDSATTYVQPDYFRADEQRNLGQGSGIDDRFGR